MVPRQTRRGAGVERAQMETVLGRLPAQTYNAHTFTKNGAFCPCRRRRARLGDAASVAATGGGGTGGGLSNAAAARPRREER